MLYDKGSLAGLVHTHDPKSDPKKIKGQFGMGVSWEKLGTP